jgi:cell division protease FtsH
MPELITRPVIVNLWGMTGVGKTDLIRTLVKELKYGDRFLEIQLTNKGGFFHNTIQQSLSNSSIEFDSPGILLLDEVQRFRTKEEDGSEIHDCKFQDLWMLLSDGCFSNNAGFKESLIELIFDGKYYNQLDDEDEEEETSREELLKKKDKEKKRKYHRSYYSAKALKKKLRLTETVDELMKWTNNKKMDVVLKALNSSQTFEGDSYSKLLIFISGNLDEAYNMADQTGDADSDADVFHEFSSKINIVDIKDSLNRRFKPEQISRFGNIHIIYSSLSRINYQKIIRRKIREVVKGVKDNHGVTIKVDKSVNECIYRNGVFPAQGVRPVFSSVSALLGNSIPTFVLTAIEKNKKDIFLEYKKDNIVATIDGEQYKYAIECSIDKIKEDNNEDGKVKTSVHEAGHAVAYASVFGISPTQMVSSTSSSFASGFVGMHQITNSLTDVRHKIVTLMAGRVAEEIVFGEDYICAGAKGDISKATSLASSYYRDWGMGDADSHIQSPYYDTPGSGNYDVMAANTLIEKMVSDCKATAKNIIIENIDLFNDVTDKLIKNGEIKPHEFKRIAVKRGMEVEVVPPKQSVMNRFGDKLKEFKKNGSKSQRKRDSLIRCSPKPKINIAASTKKE